MKYSVFALLALSLFLFPSCQNNSSNPEATGALSTTTAEPGKPTAEQNNIREQIMTDFLAAKKETAQYTAAYDQSLETIKVMKMAWGGKSDADKAKIEQLVKEAMQFRLDYETQMNSVEQLDALSNNITLGNISMEDAQKEYKTIRARMQEAAARLPQGPGAVQSAKQQFDQAFGN